MADDPAVTAVALAVDLVRELDGDRSYPLAMLTVAARTSKPVAVLSNVGSAVDLEAAARVRALLSGVRGAAADRDGVTGAITAVSALAVELGDAFEALDVNPLICSPAGAVAVDALVIPRSAQASMPGRRAS